MHRFIQDVSFDDVAMRTMGAAFDQACDALGNFGTSVTAREIVAKRIIEVAKLGERDQSRLYRHAVDGLGIDKRLPNKWQRKAKTPPGLRFDHVSPA